MKKHISNLHKLGIRSLPANFGPLKNATANAGVKGPCGDTMEMWLEIDEQQIRHATFITDGCQSSLACGAMAAWLAEGKSLDEAWKLFPVDIFKAAGEWVEEHCALLAINALRAALDDYQRQQKPSADPHQNLDLSNECHGLP